jgi:hypothetical protein
MVGGLGTTITSTDPTGGARAWTPADIDNQTYLNAVSCASTSLCVAVGDSGDAHATTNPTAATPTWSNPLQIDNRNTLTGISYPSASLCVAIDNVGNVIVGALPPTAAQIKRALVRQLAPHGARARISMLLNTDGYSASIRALTAGHLRIDWDHLSSGGGGRLTPSGPSAF